MIADLPASGGTKEGSVPLPAGGTVVISGSDLEAREDKHEGFGECRHGVGASGQKCMRWFSSGGALGC